MRRIMPFILAAFIVFSVATMTVTEARDTNLPLPRFVSLKADEVNLRTGPGQRYPIDWVFVRRALPLEVTAEFDQWRRIRDQDGTVGWVHRSMLSGERMVVVIGAVRTLRGEPKSNGVALLRLEPGVQGSLLACQNAWCRIDQQGTKGWLQRAYLWGVYPSENFE